MWRGKQLKCYLLKIATLRFSTIFWRQEDNFCIYQGDQEDNFWIYQGDQDNICIYHGDQPKERNSNITSDEWWRHHRRHLSLQDFKSTVCSPIGRASQVISNTLRVRLLVNIQLPFSSIANQMIDTTQLGCLLANHVMDMGTLHCQLMNSTCQLDKIMSTCSKCRFIRS